MTAFVWNFWSFAAIRVLAGAGIGAAINSAIDELIPYRSLEDIARPFTARPAVRVGPPSRYECRVLVR